MRNFIMTAAELREKYKSPQKHFLPTDAYMKWIYAKIEQAAEKGRNNRDTITYGMTSEPPVGEQLKEIVDKLRNEGYTVEHPLDLSRMIIKW